MFDVRQVTILGTGLLGGSIGLGLRAAGFRGRVVGYGRRMETLDAARQRRCIDEGFTLLDRAVSGSDLLVLATPISAISDLLAQLADHPAVLTDVGSTKGDLCAAARRLLKHPTRFVGSHPMAGSEQHGPVHAQPDLFRGRLCILTPAGTDATPEAVTLVETLWRTLGMTVTHKTPAEHDRLVATISHLPHALAALLVQLADRDRAISVASTGFRDTTRIASGDPKVWLDIFLTNRQAMLEALDRFTGDLASLRAAIDRNDADAILTALTQAKRARDAWVNKG